MAHWSLINDIVSETMKAHPLPDTVEEFDAVTRRRIEALALEKGTTPANILAVLKAQQAADVANESKTSDVVRAVRQRQ